MRLRHGNFTVECPDCGGSLVFEAMSKGDGAFHDDERGFYLEEARKAILEYYSCSTNS